MADLTTTENCIACGRTKFEHDEEFVYLRLAKMKLWRRGTYRGAPEQPCTPEPKLMAHKTGKGICLKCAAGLGILNLLGAEFFISDADVV